MKKFSIFISALLGFGLFSTGVYLYKTSYPLSSNRISRGLDSSVEISIDQSDVPHIKASSEKDAHYALGYLHAIERSWQIEFSRRLASGELSEILGEELLGIDSFLRTLGIKKQAQKQYLNYTNEDKELIQSYVAGINAGNENLGIWLPLEYYLLGTKPAKYRAEDAIALMLLMALDLGGNWEKELSRLEYSRSLTTDQIWEISPPYPNTQRLTSIDFASLYRKYEIFRENKTLESKISAASFLQSPSKVRVDELIKFGKEGIGSNNWVVSGKLTNTGKSILANDPHLTLTAPSTWYFAHLSAPGLDVIGASLPGIPGIVIGKNKNIAWGFSNTNPDVQDLYLEKISEKDRNSYISNNFSIPFESRKEQIFIKDRNSIDLNVKESRHGPIISDVDERLHQLINTDNYAVAFRWTALDQANTSLSSIFAINRAKNIEQLKMALKRLYAPMQNVVFADDRGNIGLQVAGVAPIRSIGKNLYGVAPEFGWNSENDWRGYLEFEKLPTLLNPPEGFIVMANQKIDSANNPNPLTGDWDMPFRYERIKTLLNEEKKHSVEKSRAIQKDTISLGAIPLLKLFKDSESKHPLFLKVKEVIQNFDGDMTVGRSVPLIFNSWADKLTRLTIGSRLGKGFDEDYGKRGFRNGLINITRNPNSPWCDLPSTLKIEDCIETSSKALTLALDELSKQYGSNPAKWDWGDAHIAISEHRPFGDVPLLSKIFNVQSPISGDNFTVNVGRLELGRAKNPFISKESPSFRLIFDFSDEDHSGYVLPTGQSGWIQNEGYSNQKSQWLKNQLYPLRMKPITTLRKISLLPKQSDN
jgi:penicillin amidase